MKKNNSAVEKVRVDLDIDEHIKMQEKGWLLQTVGIYFIFAFVLSAALGLYGNGITSKRNLNKNEAAIEYERFFRAEAKMDLKIKTTSAQNVTVSFPARYLNHFEIASIVPQPGESRFEGDHVQYVFNGRDGMEITFYLVPQKRGQVEGSIKINDNLFTINHFIFP
jgi:hypothetical protein